MTSTMRFHTAHHNYISNQVTYQNLSVWANLLPQMTTLQKTPPKSKRKTNKNLQTNPKLTSQHSGRKSSLLHLPGAVRLSLLTLALQLWAVRRLTRWPLLFSCIL